MKSMMSSSPMLWGVTKRLRLVFVLLALLWGTVWLVLQAGGG